MPFITSEGTFDCVFCALDSHYCYACGESIGHDLENFCNQGCRDHFLSGEGWLGVCAELGCEEPTYTRHETVCWTHLPPEEDTGDDE